MGGTERDEVSRKKGGIGREMTRGRRIGRLERDGRKSCLNQASSGRG